MVSFSDYEPCPPRARLGFIIPASNRMVEPQVQKYCPDGVVPHFNRVGMTNRHAAPLEELQPRIVYAAELLGDSKVDVTVLQCTGTSMSGGADGERAIVEAMAAVTGKPAISTASSVTAALAALGANRIIFASESRQEAHEKKDKYLRAAGYDLLASQGMGFPGSDVYCTTPAQYWLDAISEMKDDRAEACFISCANIHATDVIPELEDALGCPVLTSNQAALWCALRTAGIDDNVPALGQIFRHGLMSSAAAAE